jgi:hypothetical protein
MVLAIGPPVSWEKDIGIMPLLLMRPTVVLIPTIPLLLAGQTIDPSVSLPIAITQRLEATATAESELDPDGFRVRS